MTEHSKKNKKRLRERSPLTLLLRLSVLFILVVSFLIITLSIAGKHYLDKRPEVQEDLVQRVSESFGVPISVGDLSVGWDWRGPKLIAKNLSFYANQKIENPVIVFEQVSVVLDLVGYVKDWKLHVADVTLSGSEISLAHRENEWILNAHPLSVFSQFEERMSSSEKNTNQASENNQALGFKIPKGKFSVEKINFVYFGETNEELVRFNSMSAFVDNDAIKTRINFKAEDNPLYKQLELSATSDNGAILSERNWQLLLEVNDLSAQRFFQDWKRMEMRLPDSMPRLSDPSSSTRLLQGSVSSKIWSEFKAGELFGVNGHLGLYDLSFESPLNGKMAVKNIDELSFSIELNKQYRWQEAHLGSASERTIESLNMRANVNGSADLNSNALGDERVEENQIPVNNSSEYVLQEETLLRLSKWKVITDLGLWPQSDVNIKRIEYFSRDDAADFVDLPEVNTIARSEQQATTKNLTKVGLQDKRYELSVEYLYLNDIAPLLSMLASGGLLPVNKALAIDWQRLQGKIEDAQVIVLENNAESIENNEREKRLNIQSLNAQFSDLSVPLMNKQLLIAGLNGAIEFSGKKGILNVNSDNLQYEHLDVFRSALDFDRFSVSAAIEREGNNWSVTTDTVDLSNQDFSLQGTISAQLFEQEIEIDTTMRALPNGVEGLKKYYPVKIMKTGLVDWLETGLTGGEVEEVDIKLQGKLTDFPFRNNTGVFKVEFPVKNLGIEYADNWPGLNLIAGDVVFLNEGASIDVSVGESGELGRFPFKAHFDDIATEPLLLDIKQQELNLPKAVTWLQRTPIYPKLAGYLDNVSIQSDALTDLNVSIPLGNPAQTTLSGRIRLKGNELKVSALDDVFEKVVGDIYFTQDTISAEGVEALIRNQAIVADVVHSSEAIVINVAGDADMASLLQSDYVTGRSNFTAKINVPNLKEQVSVSQDSGNQGLDSQASVNQEVGIDYIDIQSNLLGASINLPAPFAKTPESILPLSVRLDMNTIKQGDLNLIGFSGTLDNTLLQGRIQTGAKQQHLELTEQLNNESTSNNSLELFSLALIGNNRTEYLEKVDVTQSQIQVLGSFSQLDSDDWVTFVANRDEGASEIELGLVDIEIDEMVLLGESLSNVELQVMPNQNVWAMTLVDDAMQGSMTVPRPWSDVLPLKVEMERMYFSADTLASTDDRDRYNPLDDIDVTKIPNMNLDISDLRYGSMQLGAFTGSIVQDGKGASLKDVLINNPDFNVTANAGWFNTDEGEQTLFSMQLNSTNFANALSRMGFAPAASARLAEADIELNWQGNPLDDFLQDVSGKVSFNLRNGSLQEVDPGAGRFLALLSIAQLPSRLSLDFRDVFGRGLKYDEMRGDFLISNGQAYTNNMLMRGPVADLGVIGRVGLGTKDFEQAAVVRADFGSSLPIAGALAGGLGVGAAVLLFSEIFKRPIKNATQIFYQIEGDWDNPEIKRINSSQLKEIPIAP